MDDTAEKLAIRDSFLRKLAARQSPDERMREMWRMRQAAWDRMQRIPEAWNLYSASSLRKEPLMSAPNISNDEKIFGTLKKQGVPFIVIGGHAVNRHGYMRVTADVDVVWLRSIESQKALLAALIELQAVWIGREIDPATGIERTFPVSAAYIHVEHLMMLWTPYGPLDLFDYIPGLPAEDVQELFKAGVEGDGLIFSSLGWLRKMKRISGRTKDMADLEELAKLHPEE